MSTPKDTDNKKGLSSQLSRLEAIVGWFESRTQVDVEEGLVKAKEGAELISSIKKRLKEVENEFEEIKKGMEED